MHKTLKTRISAASIILFAILVVVSLIQMRLLRVNESDLS